MRERFLSKIVYQTYNGYVMSQFKKMQADLRNQGKVKWKHVMHLLRLLLSGIRVLREGYVPVRVEEHREHGLELAGSLAWWLGLPTYSIVKSRVRTLGRDASALQVLL